MYVIYSSRTDVFENLAAEDILLDDHQLTEPVVWIYRNTDAVVIGKNQNPWRECAVSELEALGIHFARRVSGGGAVFHDAGNVNISCILPRENYRRDEVLQTFIKGLAIAGIHAELTGGTSLAVGGRKISGNAFCYRRDKVLHHGTLLWQANLDRLHTALKPDISSMTTRAVASAPMPVMNLADVVPRMEPVIDAIIAALATRWGAVRATNDSPFDTPGFTERVYHMKSWEWRFGATPDFECAVDEAKLTIHRGCVSAVSGPSRFKVGDRFSSVPMEKSSNHWKN